METTKDLALQPVDSRNYAHQVGTIRHHLQRIAGCQEALRLDLPAAAEASVCAEIAAARQDLETAQAEHLAAVARTPHITRGRIA